jgi:hypothetical protein
VVGSKLVGKRLSQCLAPSTHFHFNRRHGRPSRANEISSTTENGNFHANIETLVAEPRRHRFAQIRLNAKIHGPTDAASTENLDCPSGERFPQRDFLPRTQVPSALGSLAGLTFFAILLSLLAYFGWLRRALTRRHSGTFSQQPRL